ncbi:hypothetical protein [Streptomyces sp. SID5910]|uniref:hypothetical protein n=1 Tax=Streptomyces sp. SID5910 TaxID=2690312 RepID=UPI001371BFE7|nr:hypothetical protein [Streptomyces sp. SID5910]MYR46382.1 hypothetical protein [Streptomyces sp. SID5910]
MGGSGAGTRRRLAAGAAVLTAAGLLAVAAPHDAQAAAAAACAGRKVRTLPFATGSVLVYRSGGYVCAVTVPKRTGAARQMSVSVQARGGRPVVDAGRFTYRAGPVTVYAGQRCVWVRGAVDRSTVSSGWILC